MTAFDPEPHFDRVRSTPGDDALLAREAVELAGRLLDAARRERSLSERHQGARLARMMEDPAGKAFTMAMADRAFRPPTRARSASQLRQLVFSHGVPEYLGILERLAMLIGSTASALVPGLVMPAITGAMRAQSSAVILPAETNRLRPLVERRTRAGMRMNLNELGEAVLGEQEARNRMDNLLARLRSPDCECLSVKISSIFSQIHLIGREATLDRAAERLRLLYRAAMEHPDRRGRPKLVNLDMEEYRDLHLTCEVFRRVLDEPEFRPLSAGIVLQAYLPDAWPMQRELNAWARARIADGGAHIRIRIVKGANLAMERVEAELHGWPCAVYASKEEVDANFKRMIHEACRRENAEAVTIGVASHNLFDIAYALLLREREGVTGHVELEMLEGMANHQARVVRQAAGDLLLYAPVVRRKDFHNAIAYLVRRLDENTAKDNFLRDQFAMTQGDAAWNRQKERFLLACARKDKVSARPRRTQNRAADNAIPLPDLTPFRNAPDTDWSLPHNVAWIHSHLEAERANSPVNPPPGVGAQPFTPATPDELEAALQTAVRARPNWRSRGAAGRAAILRRVAAEIENRRGRIIATMVRDADKAAAEADVEVSEAVDFANYYADSLRAPGFDDAVTFEPFGTVAVTPPWNFPFAIPCGGVLAALAAGNTVILKPASATAPTGRVLAECLWAAGVPRDALLFITCGSETGRALVTDNRVGAVILTGAYDTARRFLGWKPSMRLFAETSGKNAMIISAAADPDLAVKDLVRSAFGHSGQKCSAASLAIVEAELYDHPPFLRQLRDAAASLAVGSPWRTDSVVTPCTVPPGDDLIRGLTRLYPGETWLLEPRMIDDNPRLWSPGIRLGVDPRGWYRRTECFGPVLGLIRADDLEHAIHIQNDSEFGLTGGIHTLDEREIAVWLDSVEVGNAYINRPITGAIVRRQPFGGWKRSCFGPGAKAGGPNYVAQFGIFTDDGLPKLRETPRADAAALLAVLTDALPEHAEALTAAAGSDAWWDAQEFSIEHDPSALHCEANRFRYRRLQNAIIRATSRVSDRDVARMLLVARASGTQTTLSLDEPRPWLDRAGIRAVVENEQTLVERLPQARADGAGLVRAPDSGETHLKSAAIGAAMRWADAPVLLNARVEWPAWLREQSISQTLHRYGNVVPRMTPDSALT